MNTLYAYTQDVKELANPNTYKPILWLIYPQF